MTSLPAMALCMRARHPGRWPGRNGSCGVGRGCCGWGGCGRTRGGYLGVVVPRLGIAALAIALVGGCGWGGDDGRDRNPANQPGYARPGDERSGADSRAHVVRGSAAGVRGPAALELVNHADVVWVRAADLGGDLFRVSTPDGAGVAPSADVDGARVVVGLRDTGRAGPATVTVLLSSGFIWDVRLAGGATDEAVDLTGARGGNVEFAAGTSRAVVALPAASGTQRVTMSGGASQFVVRLSGAAPVRVAASNGAGTVTIDGTTHSGVGGGTVWTPDGWDAAANRFDVQASAGVAALTVERT